MGVLAALLVSLTVAGCASTSSEEQAALTAPAAEWETIPEEAAAEETTEEAATAATTAEEEKKEIPEGMYRSELTGLPISTDLQNQRPIAMMVDNDERSLPHYGVVDCDIVYEMMNSTDLNRVTRLMCILKDWNSITQLGSIRSTRPTNIILTPEYNAVLCHDGGPVYNDEYWAQSWAPPHFSGYFSRVDNGKAREFTEYCLTGEMAKRFASEGVSTTYTANPGDHFQFADYGTEIDLSEDYEGEALKADTIGLNFTHNSSQLHYNESTQTYDYYEYGAAAADGTTGAVMTYKNAILMSCPFYVYDAHGYLRYEVINSDQPGYYLTDGYAIPITWSKASATDKTRYYDKAGKEITLNSGKTYIAICPNDTWTSNVTIQ